MINQYGFLKDLNEQQQKICTSTDNYILTACPGSGKTRTVTYRLAYLSKKYNSSNKLNIAITFTNKAADEIESRLQNLIGDKKSVWTGTIHQFCMKFIIRPYAMYHEKLKKGYTIIDEYISSEYQYGIIKKKGINRPFNLNENYTGKEDVLKKYYEMISERKEIDYDKILIYSKELLQNNRFIASQIGGIIRSIHVDEYQDTNENQYIILSEIIKGNMDINILFVGDTNQAIYRGLGGVAKTAAQIRHLFLIDFVEDCLSGCYRSTNQIVNYYKKFEVNQTNAYSRASIKNNEGIIYYNYSIEKDDLVVFISNIIKKRLEEGIDEGNICIVAPIWALIYPVATKLKEILPDCNFDAPSVVPIKYDPLNVYYLIAYILFTRNFHRGFVRRKFSKIILDILKNDYNCSIDEKVTNFDILKVINTTQYIENNGMQTIQNSINEVFQFLNIRIEGKLKDIYDKFFKNTEDRLNKFKLDFKCSSIERSLCERKGIVISTIHGIKGEEFNTVIGFGLLNGYLPNWSYIMEDDLIPLRLDESKKMLYVLCSRAKENLYLFSEKGYFTRTRKEYEPTSELIYL